MPRGKVYLDVGTGEGAGTLRDVRRLGRLLVGKDSDAGAARSRRPRRSSADRRTASSLRYVEDAGARHTEAAWAWRLQGALEFLLS